MVSILTVPEKKSGTAITVALTPADTRAWLEKLSHDESGESLTGIYHELHDLNRIPLKPGLRLRLLEPYRATVSHIGENIEVGLAAMDIPFPKTQAILAEICRRVVIEMAYGYKSVVLDLARQIRSSRANKDLCTAIHRSIHYLSLTVYRSTLYYNSQPPGTWVEIHSLFGYARKLGMEQTPVKDALNKSRPKNTISHVYQQAILYGMSDAYRLGTPVMCKLYRFLDRWGSLVDTSEFDSAPDTRCQFLVDPEQDRPAQVLDQRTAPKRTRSMLLVDARAITNVAHSQWHVLRKGSKPKANGLGDGFYDGHGFDMLEQVIRAWGVAPRRKFPRNPISGPFQLVTGISSSVFCINGERAFKGASTRIDAESKAPAGTIVEPQRSVRTEIPDIQIWTGINESIYGICLAVDLGRASGVLIRIGEVVAYRTDRGNARWSAGLVRWACTTDAELRMGIQQFGANCRPAVVFPVYVPERPGEGFRPAVFVPADVDAKRQPSLVTPAGTFRINRKMVIDDGTVTRMALAGKLLERGPHFDWFEFSLVSQQLDTPG